MGWDRHDHVGQAFFVVLAKSLPQACCEPGAQRRYPLVLQEHDGAGHVLGVGAVAAGEIKIIEAAAANMAERQVLDFDRYG
jgi:hypothetical protein